MLAALVMVFSLPESLRLFPDILPVLVERALLVLGTVWFVNAVNFLDGLDWITAAQVVPMTLGVAVLQVLGAVPAGVGFLALALLGVRLLRRWDSGGVSWGLIVEVEAYGGPEDRAPGCDQTDVRDTPVDRRRLPRAFDVDAG